MDACKSVDLKTVTQAPSQLMKYVKGAVISDVWHIHIEENKV